ncbi:MAG: lantibiotic dehydratase [Flavobacteriales bacterium]
MSKNIPYNFNQHIILRTPTKPIQTKFDEKELMSFFSEKRNIEALYLSSISLYNKFILLKDDEIDDEIIKEKIYLALLKYALRMHNRCTPFGLLASCSVINWNEKTNLLIDSSLQRYSQLDMFYVAFLAHNLEKLDHIKPHLLYFPNSSILKSTDKIKYIEYIYKNDRRIHTFNIVEKSEYLDKILNQSKNGSKISDLINFLVNNDINEFEAESFVNELIESQILVSELTPSVTGIDFFSLLRTKISSINELYHNKDLQNISKTLNNLNNSLSQLDKNDYNKIDVYEKILYDIDSLGVKYKKDKIFQVDTFKNIKHSSLNDELKSKLSKAITILNKLTPRLNNSIHLEDFKKEFQNRYQQREVKLITVLDDEFGLNYSKGVNSINPLLKGVNLEVEPNSRNIRWDNVQSFLLKKLIDALKNDVYSININQQEIEEFHDDWENSPISLSVSFSIIDDNKENPSIYLQNISGNAGNLLARFGLGNKKINNALNEIIENENNTLNENVVLAEVVHLPQNRIGNVIKRPALRHFEIPYLTQSILPKKQQLDLDDIYVSVRNNKIRLISKRLNKEIIPRSTNAYNFNGYSLPIFRFLCDLQHQDTKHSLYFNWGNLRNEFKFLPRVQILDNVIISLASWNFNKEDYNHLLNKNNDTLKEVRLWQVKWNIPNLVLFKKSDNTILIDFTSDLSLKMFVSLIKNETDIILTEFIYHQQNTLIKDSDGSSYANEFIVSLSKNIKNKYDSLSYNGYKTTQRDFFLGSEWLFYKIYCGTNAADVILTDCLYPLIEKLKEKKIIDKWFFIRYNDPDRHLRVRFHLVDLNKLTFLINEVHKELNCFVQNGLIWKYTNDVYQRELERYGDNTIELAESFFYHDSTLVVSFLSNIDGLDKEELRWQFAFYSINEFLNDFNYTIEEKIKLFDELKIYYSSNFKLNKFVKLNIDKTYRENRKKIETVLAFSSDNSNLMFELIKKRSNMSKAIIDTFLNLKEEKKLKISINQLLKSHIHMFVNRLYKDKQNVHEVVIYDFLHRHYRSELAKQKNKKILVD